MLALRPFLRLTLAFVLPSATACAPTRAAEPIAPEEPPEPIERASGTRAIVAQPPEAGAAEYDRAIADMVAECDAVLESLGGAEPPAVRDRRVDLDGDGRDEAIVNVSCEDVSTWRVLTIVGGEAVVMLEKPGTSTSFDVVRGPDGRPLLVAQHDCCCAYELEVLAMKDRALEPLLSWSSGCAPGCSDGSGYQAELVKGADARLVSLTLPVGECGAEGGETVDLASWTASPAPP